MSHRRRSVRVASNAHRNHLVRKFCVGTRKIFSPQLGRYQPLQADANDAQGERQNRIRGVLTFVKNVFSLVEAMKGISEAKLYLIGDGPLRRPLEQKLREEKVSNIVLLGTVPHKSLPTELNKSEIFVLPSLYDGSPRALIEAMACGLPVIESRWIFLCIVEDMVTGLICDLDSASIREGHYRTTVRFQFDSQWVERQNACREELLFSESARKRNSGHQFSTEK